MVKIPLSDAVAYSHPHDFSKLSFVFVAFLYLTLFLESSSAYFPHCSDLQFACLRDGKCIAKELVCNGRQECSDGSDELDCDMKLCQKPNWFQCTPTNGPCLSSELICNGVQNCPAGEDERYCVRGKRVDSLSSSDIGTGGWSLAARNCTAYEYTCLSDKTCIPLNFMCDGKRHCSDGSDEIAGCITAASNCGGFFCRNRKCLESKKWLCDGVDDCGDGSDEEQCGAINCKIEDKNFLCSDNITCIELSKVCDGAPQCSDKSDEGIHCKDSNDCSKKVCPPAAKCYMFPASGAECLCPKGYKLSTLQNACVDINECLEVYGVCSQNCENTPGGYKCSCDEGYTLQKDNMTCKANGDEALLLYSTQITVMGVHLDSLRVYTVAKNLTKVIGVAFDGDHIYWTNIQNEGESIVKSKSDGSQQETLLTSGLDAPEDLAVDWLTGNIYFSDNVMRHIAVCSNDGHTCAVLVTIDVHQPRGIALWPQKGQMFWTDWGNKPMIARASMDGNKFLSIVTENIHWPNGIALDMHNNRLYWVDAKLATMESVRPDGTDRRIILNEILKHPYGLAIFENKIYWSDWGTKSIHSCNKFSCKDHKIIVKDRTIYAVHIYHPSKQPHTSHACTNNKCSHLCLLAENNTFSCMCPDGMHIGLDQLRCVKTLKKQRLFIGVKSSLLEMEHTTFGRHAIAQTHQLPAYIHELAFNNVNGTIIIVDNIQRGIFEYDMSKDHLDILVSGNIGNISSIAFDYLAYNVYWTDSERHVIEVFSLISRQRAVVNFFAGVETPIAISVMPENGYMFVALRNRRNIHIDRFPMSGLGEHKHVFEDDLGDDDIKFAIDYDSKTLYWSDSDLGRISYSDYHRMVYHSIRARLKKPYGIALVDDDIFWSQINSNSLFWTHRSTMGPMKRIDIEATKGTFTHLMPSKIPLISSSSIIRLDHPCQKNNGGCSHVCVVRDQSSSSCLCPAGLVFRDNRNKTCIESLDCEFRCSTGECLTQSRRCNGRKDCPDNSDEIGCDRSEKKTKVICGIGEFSCHNSEQCIDAQKRCDGHKDCRDNSDELHCEKFDKGKFCHRNQHVCDNGKCVDFSVMCDGVDDCGDRSDEKNCKSQASKDEVIGRPKCDKTMFQCNSGTCIPKKWECDGKIDCSDSSDEHEKCDLRECEENMHKCLMGQCIDRRLVCDGHNDCGDLSDEQNCDYISMKVKPKDTQCGVEGQPKFQCTSNPKICLELSAKCNGTAECPRGEDEMDCGSSCGLNEFECIRDKLCIRKEFHCDGDRDCLDGSDELNCESFKNETLKKESVERPCETNMFNCHDGQCVDMSRVCNGFMDCLNGADEGALCETACKSSGKPVCQHKCRPTPTGASCSCFDGYKLDSDFKTCVDINECEQMDPCAQICENSRGSFRCSCYPDFMLRQDRMSCKSIESDFKLMFSTYNEVRSMTEMPVVLKVAWSANDSKINGFDVNVRARKAYFTTDSEDALYMLDMETGQPKAALSIDGPSKVAVDWITDNVYVISRSNRYSINVCCFKTKMCGRLVTMNNHEILKSLVVDSYNRKLFYAIIISTSFGNPISQIGISNLDGSKREILYKKNGAYITSMSIDPHKKLLYFTDMHTKTLQAVSYKMGAFSSAQTIIRKSNMIIHPSGLSIYENEAFIVNIGNRDAIRCRLYGSKECKAFNLNILNAEDITIDGASRQPLKTNPCVMAKCSGMCIQAEHGYECLCGNNIIQEHEACANHYSNEITGSSLLTRSDTDNRDSDSSSHSSLTISLCLLLLALVGGGIGYFYYRRLKQGHRDLNINLHFQNPLASSDNNKATSPTTHSRSSATTTASFEADRDRMQFGMSSIARFLHGPSSNSTTEVSLDTEMPSQVPATGKVAILPPCALVEDDSDDEYTRTSGAYNDDTNARSQLLP